MARKSFLLTAIVFEGGLLALAWGLGAVLDAPAFGALRVTAQDAAWGVLASLPMLGGLAWAARSAWPPFVRLRQAVEDVVALFADCSLLDLALISALAGLGEEALFRGVGQIALAGVVGVWVAVVVVGVAFGVAHFISLTYAVYAAVVGVYLGVLLVVFDNLLVPVVAHAFYDFVALTYLLQAQRGLWGHEPKATDRR